MNKTDSTCVSEPSGPSAFIRNITKQIRLGASFVPFVGSGISARSGILMGQEFTQYLATTLYKAVGSPKARWKMRTQGWPADATPDELDDCVDWFSKTYKKVCRRSGLDVNIENGQVQGFSFAHGIDEFARAHTSFATTLNRPLIPAILAGKFNRTADQQLKELLRIWIADESSASQAASSRFVSTAGISKTSEEYITERAIRAAHDWRATLEFLASLEQDHSGSLCVTNRDQAVIDGFNIHITANRQPNLAHKMLAHLWRSLRARVLLTTNFDTLLEQAFRQIEYGIQVIPVSSRGELPDPRTIYACPTIVKMHGSLLETRADFSLDSEPSQADKQRFASYLGVDHHGKPLVFTPQHLLVIGYSGSDYRCIQLIKAALERSPKTQVYWVCYDENDLQRLKVTFFEEDFKNRIITCVSRRPDLLLYDLYQLINLSLPSGGFSFQFSPRVPPSRADGADSSSLSIVDHLVSQCDTKGENDDFDIEVEASALLGSDSIESKALARQAVAIAASQEIRRQIFNVKASTNDLLNRYVRCTREKQHPGFEGSLANPPLVVRCSGSSVDTAGRLVVDLEQKHRKRVIWLELQDHANYRALARDFLVNLTLAVGKFQLEHINLLPSLPSDDWPVELLKWMRRVTKYLKINTDDWIICVYGRTGPGACSSWGGEIAKWCSVKTDTTRNEYSKFEKLRWTWASAGFHVVYFPLTPDRLEDDRRKLNVTNGYLKKARAKLEEMQDSDAPLPQISEDEHDQIDFEYKKFDFLELKGPNYGEAKCPFEEESVDSALDLPESSMPLNRLTGRYLKIMQQVCEEWLKPLIENPHEVDNIQKVKFLYSVSLFRQSRHSSAFFSDAALRSSSSKHLNILGADLHWDRYEVTERWISELREARVFFEKDGGFCWMHRDVRLGIQMLVESLRCEQGIGGVRGKSYTSFLDIRSRLHDYIADWYFRAFLSTAHWTPVIEGLFHYAQAARYAELARPQKKSDTANLKKYRQSRFQVAVRSMIKLLRIARPHLAYWLTDSEGNAMLDPNKHARDLLGQLREQEIQFGEKDSRSDLTNALQRELSRTNLAILSSQHIDEEKLSGLSEFAPTIGSIDIPDDAHELQGSLGKMLSGITVFRDELWLESSGDCPHWIETTSSEIFNGNENVASTLASIWKLNPDLEGPAQGSSDEALGEAELDLRFHLRSWISACSSEPLKILRAVEYFSEVAYLHIRRAKLKERIVVTQYSQKGSALKPENWVGVGPDFFALPPASGRTLLPIEEWQVVRLLYRQALIAANMGTMICSAIDPIFRYRELQLRSKLETLCGLSLGYLDRYYEANSHLTSAQAFLSKCGAGMDLVQLAVIRLRRAEVHLRHALRLADVTADSAHWLQSYSDALKNNEHFDPEDYFEKLIKLKSESREIPVTCKGLYSELQKKSNPNITERIECWHRSLLKLRAATIDDAAEMLDQAAAGIAGKSHHALWWGRVHALRLMLACADDRLRKDWDCEIGAKEPSNMKWSLARRHPIDHYAECRKTYESGMLATAHSYFRQLRLIEYFMRYTETLEPFHKADIDFDAVARDLIRIIRNPGIELKIDSPGGPHPEFDTAGRDSDSGKTETYLFNLRHILMQNGNENEQVERLAKDNPERRKKSCIETYALQLLDICSSEIRDRLEDHGLTLD